jgi:hypothetical protein
MCSIGSGSIHGERLFSGKVKKALRFFLHYPGSRIEVRRLFCGTLYKLGCKKSAFLLILYLNFLCFGNRLKKKGLFDFTVLLLREFGSVDTVGFSSEFKLLSSGF